jgi:putative tryptophan/tyrosine transport system substrate-binding protein
MRRREVLMLLLGAALWSAAVDETYAQADRVRVVGVLFSQTERDQEAEDRLAALRDGLLKLGWSEGRNLRIEARYARGSAELMNEQAASLAQLQPDLLFAAATSSLAAFKKVAGPIPIVFAQVTDPVSAGFVDNLARPGGNITGFSQHDFSISIKWIELLKQLASQTETVGLVYDPQNPATAGYLSEIKSNIHLFGMQLVEHPVRNASEIEHAMRSISGQKNSGMILLPGPSPTANRTLVIELAHALRLPAVYPFRYWVSSGGLAFYGIDNIDLYRQAAGYVDRILRGEKPGELPVQNATKFGMVINLKTAKALGITVSSALLARADEVIE